MSWLDLHMHSVVSMDGEFTPEQLVSIAQQAGVKVMAISDHNITDGVEAGVEAARERDMISIPAVELDLAHENRNFHILGYGIDPNYRELKDFCNQIRENKVHTGVLRMERMHELGYYFDDDKVWEIASQKHVIMPDILKVVFEDHRNDGNEILEPYRTHPMAGVAFYWDHCARPDSEGYIPEGNLPAEEGIKLIKQAGGVPVLAHPGANMGENREIFLSLLEAGVEGVEAFCSYHQHGEDQFYYDLARKYEVLFTQGSDFHGKLKPQISAGSIETGLEEEIYRNLRERLG